MRTKLTIISASGFIGGMAIVTFSQALAIEPPPDIAEPPAALLDGAKNSPVEKLPTIAEQNVPFLGLATAAVPDMVADHLDLDRGAGVIIRTVVPDSPAAKAGLSVNDIILSVGETPVGNPEALTSAIQERKPGERVAIDLIHKGKPAKVEVTLSERPANQVSGIEQDPMLEGLPKAHADRLRDLLERHLQDFGQNGGMDLRHFPEGWMGGNIPDINYPKGMPVPRSERRLPGGNSFEQSSTIRVMDNNGSIEIKSTNNETEVTVRDEKNEKVWSGPWNTEEDKAAAPEGIRERVEKANAGNGRGFSFRFGKPRENLPETLDN